MKSLRCGWLTGILFYCTALFTAADAQERSEAPLTDHELLQGYREGRVLIKLKEGVAEDADAPRQALESRSGVSHRRVFRHLRGQQILEFDATRPVSDVIKELAATGLYEFVEPDHIVHTLLTPNDPSFSQQWSLSNTGQSSGTAGADIGALAAWNVQSTAPSVIVAVVDSGIRLTHSDLAGNLWTNPSPTIGDVHGINATVTPTTGNPNDDDSHGSHVSGIIGAIGNNAVGISGVAWNVQLMPLKFLDSTGNGTLSAEITCLDYAIAHGASIINGSFGSNTFSNTEFSAMQRVHDAGIIMVVAAGNDALPTEADNSYPAGFLLDNMVTVAATTRNDVLATYSDFSAGSTDIAAPGDQILSSVNTGDNDYALKSGTSMAAPHVAGALALMKAQFPGDNYRQLINRLLRSSTKLASLSGKVQSGGRLQLANALNSTDNRPFNDNFSERAQISGANLRVRSSNVGATRENGEPAHAGVAGSGSLWWSWTAPTTTTVVLDTTGTSYNTTLAVYTGNTLGSLTLVAANDDAQSGVGTSRLTFNATGGTTYQIACDIKSGTAGLTVLNIRPDSLWQFSTNAGTTSGVGGITGSPAIAADGTVVIGSADNFVYAVNPDGSQKWRRTTTGSIADASPAIGSDGTVYIGSTDTRLYAFNGATGVPRWTFTAATAITSAPAIAADGTIYFRDDTSLYALTSGATSATQKWKFTLGGTGTYCSPAIATDGTVYVGTTGGAFYAVTPAGAQKWIFTADGDIYTSPAIGTDGTVYFGTLNGKVYAIRPDGTQKWVFTTAGNSSVTSSPAIGSDGTLYFGAYDHKLHALGSDGVEKWTFTAGSDVRASSPAIAADGTIYFGDYDFNVYAVSSSGSLVRTYPTDQIIRSSPVIANGRLYFGSADFKLYAYTLNQNRLSSAWAGYHHDPLHTGQAPISPPITISAQPQTQFVTIGSNVTFSETATGTGPLSYQWLLNGTAIAGATSSTYTIANVQPASEGNYSVILTDSSGSLTSASAVLFVSSGTASSDARLFAISCRALVGTGSDVLIPGIAVGGSGSRQVIVRASGPALISQGVGGTLAQPQLQFYHAGDSTPTATNIGWDSNAATATTLSAAFAQVGVPQFAAHSGDCALIANIQSGQAYTAVVSGLNNTTGVALVEVYELGSSSARMTALSCRASVGTGGNVLIPGIVVQGSGTKKVIIRASGPALAALGVGGTLGQPQLQLFDGSTRIASNIGWDSAGSNSAAVSAATTATGLTNFPAGSADCAILATLDAGKAYTAQVSGVNGTTGVALIEVYEVP